MSSKIPVSDEAMKKVEEANKKKAKATPELAALLNLARKKALAQNE